MDQSEALTSTRPSLCSFLVGMTTKSKSGHTRVGGVSSRSMAIWIMSVPSFSTTSCLGSFRAPTIKRYGYGIGKIGLSFAQ